MGYIAIQATDKFQSWYDSIKDKVAKRAIDLRITRIAAGLFEMSNESVKFLKSVLMLDRATVSIS